MKTSLFVLLTTLFVSAMPLQAAYAAGDGATCDAQHSYETVIDDHARDLLKEHNGTITELSGVRAKAAVDRIAEVVGSPPPYEVEDVVLIVPDDEDGTSVNIGFFNHKCLVGFMRLPPAVLEDLLNPPAPTQGERVD